MEVTRYAAFTTDPSGGNPAGLVLDAAGLSGEDMQRIAADVGDPETAFHVDRGDGVRDVRYFSPTSEVPFCGHATVASGVLLAERGERGPWTFRTQAGEVEVRAGVDADGTRTAEFTSVSTRTAPIDPADADELIAAIGWTAGDLDPALPVRAAFAGAWHAVVPASTRDRLARLDQDDDRLARLCAARGWTTVDLVHRTGPAAFACRNLGPAVGISEDPATGSAAAAFGGYLRELGAVDLPADLTLRQGEDLGRPSVLRVSVPAAPGAGVVVAGAAVPLA